MIEISLYLFLIIYLILLAGFFVFVFFNIYHLLVYGFLSFESFFMTFLLFAGIILILFITYQFGSTIDWNQTIVI